MSWVMIKRFGFSLPRSQTFGIHLHYCLESKHFLNENIFLLSNRKIK